MKNLVKTFTAAITAVVITSSVLTTFAAQQVLSEVTPNSALSFNRIWVSGNVKVVLTQGEKPSIASTGNYGLSSVSVMSNGYTLFIKSTESNQVVLNITVKDLLRIEAYGRSVIVTRNNFHVSYLQLFLNQSASAKIKTTVLSLYAVVKDNAELKVSGTADKSTMVASKMENVKLTDFATLRSESFATEAIIEEN
jgi:hypothetical protein